MGADPALSAVLPWLKTLPLAPEYRPTLAEFQDPVAYILKIEQEASRYGICKIIPPFPAAPKSTAVANLNISFSTRSPSGDPTFTTRQQQIGFCPRRPFPAQKSVWQSGVRYTLPQFEAKSRGFERAHLRKFSKKSKSSSSLSSLEIESLFWNAAADKPSSVEYANDIPGSGFSKPSEDEIGAAGAESVGETAWNMRGVARAKGSLLKFMREEIPGVTSPMVYVAMLFSWFAWHVEDHDLHSLNYLHMGAGKTWYGVPRDAALAFEDVVRVHGYGGELNPLITFATLAEKTTLMSPEVLVRSGIPCCRLVQNAGEFVVTFPGSYHSGFSHGFNCGEASNIATPEWLKVAKEAAIRRASMNCPPMVSHYQLLYSLTLSLSSRDTSSIVSTPKSSRLKNKLRCVGETMIKETFVQNVIRNNNLLNVLLDDCSSCLILPQRAFNISLCSGLTHKLQMKVKPRTALGLCHGEDTMEAVAFSDFSMGSSSWGGCSNNDFCFVEESSDSALQRTNHLTAKINNLESSGSLIFSSEMSNKVGQNNKPLTDGVLDRRLLPCVTCGILSTCVAVMRPSQAAARYIISSNCNSISSQIVGFEVDPSYNKDATRKTHKPVADLNFGNVGKIHSSVQVPVSNDGLLCNPKVERGASALDLLASAYGDLFDSEEDSNMTVVQTSDKESDRMHIFCLEHAVDVKKRLLALGGANLMLLCHPEYPKIESEAKILAEELELDYQWKTVQYKDASEEDQDQIRTAIEDEDAVPCNGDWAVKLGLNLYYSVNLSQSPLFRKQLPYNEVIRKFFTQKLPAEPNGSEKIARRQKKIILAGKWCGKVWMSNQVHPYLKDQNVIDDDDGGGDVEMNPNLEAKICKWNEKRTIVAKRNSSNYSASGRRNSGQKKESAEKSASSWETSRTILEDSGDARYAEKNINSVIRRKFGKKQKAVARLSSRKPGNVGLLDENFGDADGDRVYTDMEEDKQVIAPIKSMTNRNSSASRKEVPKKKKKSSSRISSDIGEPERAETDMHVERVGRMTRQMISLKNNKRESFNVISRQRKQGWRHSQLESVDGRAEDDRDTDPNPQSDIDPEQEKHAILLSKNFSNGFGAARKRKRSTALKASEKPLGKRRVIETALDSTAVKEDFPCDVEGCSMSLRTKKELSLHKRNVCPEAGCGKRFFSHKYLLQHRKVHSDDRPLKCPWKGCKMAFKWVWARTEHIRVHTGERPYTCREPGCDLTFRFVSDFSRHRRKTGHLSASKGS